MTVRDLGGSLQLSDLLPVVTLVGGYFLGQRSDRRRERHEAVERRTFAEADFQRSTLLELQSAVLRLVELARSDAPDTPYADARAETTRLLVRVRDRRTRANVRLLQSFCDQRRRAKGVAADDVDFDQAEAFEEFNERLGWVIRSGADTLVHLEPKSVGEVMDEVREEWPRVRRRGRLLSWRRIAAL